MSFLKDAYRRWFTPTIKPLPSGVYHYQAPAEDPLNYRLHLRIEPDGSGILIINAATVLHLNATAAEYAYHLVQATPRDQAIGEVASRYRASRETIQADFDDLLARIETLITTPDLDPVTYLDFDRHTPYSDRLSAPLRLDCALTYRLPDAAHAASAPTKRVDRELTSDEWKSIFDKAWEAGIPHLLFTGGEPTLRDDLVELITHAERNGQVTGLLTDGLKLSDTAYLNTLLQAGLDHAMIVLQPEQDESWEALASFRYWAKILEEDIFVTAHLTITPDNAPQANALLNRLAEAGVSAVSLSVNDKSLMDELQDARSHAADLDLGLVWDVPVPYSSLNPVAMELEEIEGIEAPEGAGRGWLYVEPDGDVLPTQGVNRLLGNLLADDWEAIWKTASSL